MEILVRYEPSQEGSVYTDLPTSQADRGCVTWIRRTRMYPLGNVRVVVYYARKLCIIQVIIPVLLDYDVRGDVTSIVL